MADGESDELKRVMLEGNPVFLGLTFAVSLLHSVFDMLVRWRARGAVKSSAAGAHVDGVYWRKSWPLWMMLLARHHHAF